MGVGLRGKSIPRMEFLNAFAPHANRFLFIDLQYLQPGNEAATKLTPALQKVFGEKAYSKTKIDVWDDFDSVAAMLTAIRDLGGAAVMIPNYTELIASAVGVPVFKPLHGDYKAHHGFGRAWNEDLLLYRWVRTYLQEEPGNWTGVLRNIARDLCAFADGKETTIARHDIARYKPPSAVTSRSYG
jgi:hypothetical protein